MKYILSLCLLFLLMGSCKKEEPIPTQEPAYYTKEQVDSLPEYPGGESAYHSFVKKTLLYPPDAREHQIEGTVIISFVIDTAGYPTEFDVIQSVHPVLDNETLRVLVQMPRWKAGIKNGKKVPVLLQKQIVYKLV